MKFDLNNQLDISRFKQRIEYLLQKGFKVELKQIRTTRSLSQNSYLHVVISIFAINFGLTLNEAKTDLKRTCPFMTYEKSGKKYLVETSKQDSKELTTFIDWIRNYAAQNDLYIPDAEEYKQNKFSIDSEINKWKQYL